MGERGTDPARSRGKCKSRKCACITRSEEDDDSMLSGCSFWHRSAFTHCSLFPHTYDSVRGRGCAFTGREKKRKAMAKITSSLLIRLEFLQISTMAMLRSQTYWRWLHAGENYPRCATGVKWGNRHCHSMCLYTPRTKTIATASTSNKASNPTEPEPCLLLYLNRAYSQGFNRN